MLPTNDSEPEKWKAAAQAALLLLAVFAGAVFSGDLRWGAAPPPLPLRVTTLVPSQLAPPPRPAPPAETTPQSQPQDSPPQKEEAADVVREKIKKERKEEEEREKRKEEEKRKKRDEAERKKREEEAKRKKQEEREAEEERQRRKEETRLAAEAEARNKALQNRLARLESDFAGRISKRIDDHVSTPPSVPKDDPTIVVELLVRLHPDGELRGLPEVLATSGYPEYDESAVRAVLKAAPLPMPRDKFILDDPDLMSRFTEHHLYVRP